MDDYFSLLDINYNDFINNRLNILNEKITSKNLEYQNKIKSMDKLFNVLSNSLPEKDKDKLNTFRDLCYDTATFDLHKIYTLGFMDACQIRKKYD